MQTFQNEYTCLAKKQTFQHILTKNFNCSHNNILIVYTTVHKGTHTPPTPAATVAH